MAEWKDVYSSSPARTPEWQLTTEHHQQENNGSYQKIHLSKGKREVPTSWQEG